MTRERRVALAGAIACLAILGVGRGVPRAAAWLSEERANVADLATRLQRRRTAVEHRHVTDSALAAARRGFASRAGVLFMGSRPNAAAAVAAERLLRAARNARVELGAVQVSAASGTAIVPIAMSVSGRGDIRGLMRLISDLEFGPKQFRVTRLAVNQPDVVGRPDAPESLGFEISVRTLALIGGERSPGTAAPERPVDPAAARALALVVENDPFRLDRRPAAIPFGIVKTTAPVVVVRPPPGPRPSLILRGIVGGPPWEALLEGLPGKAAGTLVRRGDHFGQLVISDINRELVVVLGPDTSWHLTLLRTWR